LQLSNFDKLIVKSGQNLDLKKQILSLPSFEILMCVNRCQFAGKFLCPRVISSRHMSLGLLPLERISSQGIGTGKSLPVSPLIRRGNRFGIPARASRSHAFTVGFHLI